VFIESDLTGLAPLRVLFPNYTKIIRVFLSECGKRGIVEFCTHSAARRALDQPPVEGFRLSWVSLDTRIPEMQYVPASLPVWANLNECFLPAPSNDWRRPRPTQTTEMVSGILCVAKALIFSGAFADEEENLVIRWLSKAC
jgi:hypothetical protein